MSDFAKYKWLDDQVRMNPEINEHTLEITPFLEMLNSKDFIYGKKNILACYYIDQLLKGAKSEKKISKLTEKDYNSWYKSASFKKTYETIINEDKNKFILSAIVSMMMTTLALFFIKALITQKFVISFSIDAIIGCVVIVLLYRNINLRYKIVRRYTKGNDIYILDGAALALCILLKIILPPVFDLTLILLFVDHYVTKKKLEKEIEIFKNNFRA